jgi:type IV secretion system protein VirB3
MSTDGYEVILHPSLCEPILLGGAPRALAILNGTLAAALGLGFQLFLPGLVLWLFGHSLAVVLARRDPDFAPVLLRHLRHRDFLSC